MITDLLSTCTLWKPVPTTRKRRLVCLMESRERLPRALTHDEREEIEPAPEARITGGMINVACSSNDTHTRKVTPELSSDTGASVRGRKKERRRNVVLARADKGDSRNFSRRGNKEPTFIDTRRCNADVGRLTRGSLAVVNNAPSDLLLCERSNNRRFARNRRESN